MKSESEVTQSCLTLIDPMDCSPPGSSVHGIFQARVLELGAIAFSGMYGWRVAISSLHPTLLENLFLYLIESCLQFLVSFFLNSFFFKIMNFHKEH